MKKSSISVYILAFNVESKIEDCIKSVTWADEVVVIDSHSTDNTAKIAEQLGAKVRQVDFNGFGSIRVAGVEHTQYEWILSVDSDERCTPEAKQEILGIINQDDSKDVYYMPRRNIFMGREIFFCDYFGEFWGTIFLSPPGYSLLNYQRLLWFVLYFFAHLQFLQVRSRQ